MTKQKDRSREMYGWSAIRKLSGFNGWTSPVEPLVGGTAGFAVDRNHRHGGVCIERRVPAAYLTSANLLVLPFFTLKEISKLRAIRRS